MRNLYSVSSSRDVTVRVLHFTAYLELSKLDARGHTIRMAYSLLLHDKDNSKGMALALHTREGHPLAIYIAVN